MSKPAHAVTTGKPGRARTLPGLVRMIEACRICRDQPDGKPLPHEPRPVLRVSASARICIVGQAPGTRVHASGIPFTDPSGDRLRSWMGVDEETFYDRRKIAIVPMGFCFPGLDASGSDLPPRKECSVWRKPLFERLPNIDLMLVVGGYAQKWHLGSQNRPTMTQTVAAWRDFTTDESHVVLPLPHPSWRNNAWLKRYPWFEADLLPELRKHVLLRLT
jgi:uracil-DNA glycosylase